MLDSTIVGDEKSTHIVEVVSVTLLPHPNADTLSLVNIDGYQVAVRTADWENGQLGAYIPPDSLVPVDRPEFAFLAKREGQTHHRVRVVRLRGYISQGLLVPAPIGSKIGDNLAQTLGVERYEPPIDSSITHGWAEKGPEGLYYPKYDVDSAHKWAKRTLREGEPLWCSEKIHGANARYVWIHDRMWCGSRSQWKKETDDCLWWQILNKISSIRDFCVDNPGTILYGEIYGRVQDLRYGLNDTAFAGFDILEANKWIEPIDAYGMAQSYRIPWVPVIHEYWKGWTFEELFALAERQSLVPGANHCAEGIVVKPIDERWDEKLGRVCLKIVSNEYLMRNQ